MTEYLGELEEAAKPFKLRIEGPWMLVQEKLKWKL